MLPFLFFFSYLLQSYCINYSCFSESQTDRQIFEQWQQENNLFISTRACEKVEKLTEHQNLIIVTGHSGSGKSAIIQHIALRYKKDGWVVKRINLLEEIEPTCTKDGKVLFVFNDPFGKELLDEKACRSWSEHNIVLKCKLKSAKLLISCRKYILHDTKVKILFKTEQIVDISSSPLKLNHIEKMKIWNSHSLNKILPREELAEINQIELYFPLLCRLYFNEDENKRKREGFKYFKEPVDVVEKEIKQFRDSGNIKYCVLILTLLNNAICKQTIHEDLKRKKEFKLALELCRMENTREDNIIDTLETLDGLFVKKIDETFHFFNNCVMDVTANVFGTTNPIETIQYADIGVLRRIVRLKKYPDQHNKLAIYLNDGDIDYLGERLSTELFGNNFLDVVLNPCLTNERVTHKLRTRLQNHPENQKQLLQKKDFPTYKKNFYQSSKNELLSKHGFLGLGNEMSYIFALIVFCHRDVSVYCLQLLKQMSTTFQGKYLFSAVCCNGAMELFNMFSKEDIKEHLREKWGPLYPVHIVSLFHNYEILQKLLEIQNDVNFETDGNWTPLILAAANDNKGYETNRKCSSNVRRDETVKLLLKHGANVNLCRKNGASSLYMACYSGHYSTVKLLLENKADVNLCKIDEVSPLYEACQNQYGSSEKLNLKVSPLYIACQIGHVSIVRLLLDNDADVNFCMENGVSPIHVASQKGHNSIIELLLSKNVNINLCTLSGASPIFLACMNGNNSTVKLLHLKGANINLCDENGTSPLCKACETGHDQIVTFLLENYADINLRKHNDASPLFIACQHGHTRFIDSLLEYGAKINFCMMDGASPLYIACQNNHEIVVKILLKKEADINLCKKDGASPLFIACQNGHYNIVKLLLENKANVNFCKEDGACPLYIACQNGHKIIVELLLSFKADVNLCNKNGVSLLYRACQNGHDNAVTLLLNNGADINVCDKNKVSPLHIACEKGHYTTVQILLQNSASVRCCTTHKASPLHLACQYGYDSIVKLLLRHGADINSCDEDGNRPIHTVCQNGHASIVQLLIPETYSSTENNQSAATFLYYSCYDVLHSAEQIDSFKEENINICDKNGASSLFKACEFGHVNIVQLLIEKHHADINVCTEDGNSPLHVACEKGHDHIVQVLLKNNAKIDSCAKDGSSPFYLACKNDRYSIVKLLLTKKADINLCKTNGTSPLFIACENGNYSIAQLLLNEKADVTLKEADRANLLFIACQNGHESIVELLLKRGANVNFCKNGSSPLFVTCQSKHENIKRDDCDSSKEDETYFPFKEYIKRYDNIVQTLLNYDADVNLSKSDGSTPLYVASEHGYYLIVQLLLQKNAKVNLCLQDGTSPLYKACQNGHYKIVQLLLSYGAYINSCSRDSTNPLYIAQQNGHDVVVKLLQSERTYIK